MCYSKDDARSASELSASAGTKQGRIAPSAESLGTIMTLLDACLSTHHMPTLQDIVSEAQEKGFHIPHPKNYRMQRLQLRFTAYCMMRPLLAHDVVMG